MGITNETKNASIFAPMEMLGKKSKRFKQLNNSWATHFRDNILPIDQIEQLYCENNGRPTKDLYALTGTLIL
ncbi:MAG: hypothetical protein LBT38_02600 [Deltaproteobacteria bacterium]|jgi:hypothetical protein|nr:hypothetical protein [Deltaproteobacteria bacterium]